MYSEYERKLLAIMISEWDQAEYVIKVADISAKQILVPSITELRYAGRDIVDYIHYSIDKDVQNYNGFFPGEKLRKAIDHAVRAKQDAFDSIFNYAYELVISAGRESSEFTSDTISADIEFMHNISQKIAFSRANRGSRSDIYGEVISSDMPKLVILIDKYSCAPVNKKRRSKRKSGVVQSMELLGINQLSVIVAVIGGLVSAITGLILAIL